METYHIWLCQVILFLALLFLLMTLHTIHSANGLNMVPVTDCITAPGCCCGNSTCKPVAFSTVYVEGVLLRVSGWGDVMQCNGSSAWSQAFGQFPNYVVCTGHPVLLGLWYRI